METAFSSNLQAIPVASNLNIVGIDRQTVNETRMGYMNAMADLEPKKPRAKTTHTPERIVQAPKQKKKPEATFRLVETTDDSLAMIMVAKAIKTGLKKGDNMMIVTPQKKHHVMVRLEMLGVDVESALSDQKLAITSFPIDKEQDLETNYRASFGELFNHANIAIDSIVMLEMDSVVNLESQQTAYTTVSKFTQAADEVGCKVIAQYSRNHSEAHDRLDAACSSLVNAYFVMSRGEENNERKFSLRVKNRPV